MLVLVSSRPGFMVGAMRALWMLNATTLLGFTGRDQG